MMIGIGIPNSHNRIPLPIHFLPDDFSPGRTTQARYGSVPDGVVRPHGVALADECLARDLLPLLSGGPHTPARQTEGGTPA